MAKEGATVPKDTAILSARKLPHGGVLYELNAPTSAEWLNIPTNRSIFLNLFDANTIIKDRAYHLIIENVPISFDPNSKTAIAEIEIKGGLQVNSISKTRYIKPVARRSLTQRTAHVAITLNSKIAANQIIRFGLPIEGKKVYGRKLLTEPTRCLKCHTFNGGHIAMNCPNENNICGTCGAEHQMATCKVDDPAFYHCVNCKEDGHASWSRECPVFTGKWNAQKARNDETRFIYFPTDDPLTWETIEGQIEEPDNQQHNQQDTAPQDHMQGWKMVHQY
ncbi:hypothetical protein BDR06DRAFT_928227 [Suillus hirtellus]|nr:hypothetical protein BDR06DRAFT_928227 [Suillus hirtellus]